MSAFFSIIVPVYKVEKYLDRCVESLVNQSYKNIEIVLVDDGSPDRCPEICDEWGKRDNRIKVIHKKNGGLSDARNTGLLASSGEYVFFVDSDDYIDLESAEKFRNYITTEDFIVGEAIIYKPNGDIKHRGHTNLVENHTYTGGEIASISISKGEWFAPVCYNVYNRNFLLNNKLLLKVGILHEDNEFQPRLFLKAKKVKYLHFEFYQYVERADSICQMPTKKNLMDLLSTYESWAQLNETIEDSTVRKKYKGALSKAFIHTCREFKVNNIIYPRGITNRYLMLNALNFKEFIKTIAFILFRGIYVRL